MAAHDNEALRLFGEGLSYEQIRERLGLTTTKQVNHAINRARKARAVEYEDKREYTEEFVTSSPQIDLQEKEKLNTRQTKASIAERRQARGCGLLGRLAHRGGRS